MSTLLVDSGYPALPFFVVDHGIDSNESVTIGSGASALEAGTVLAVSGNKYYAYTNTGGLATADGILYRDADPRNGDVISPMFVHGTVRESALTGIDAAAKTDLSGRIRFV